MLNNNNLFDHSFFIASSSYDMHFLAFAGTDRRTNVERLKNESRRTKNDEDDADDVVVVVAFSADDDDEPFGLQFVESMNVLVGKCSSPPFQQQSLVLLLSTKWASSNAPRRNRLLLLLLLLILLSCNIVVGAISRNGC